MQSDEKAQGHSQAMTFTTFTDYSHKSTEIIYLSIGTVFFGMLYISQNRIKPSK